MVLSLLLSVGLASTPAPAVQPAAGVATGLAARLGVPVEIARPLRSVPMLVDLDALPPTEALHDVAFALRATVVRDGRTLRVERTPADERALRAVPQHRLRDQIVGALAVWDRRLKQAEGLGDVAAQLRRVRAQVDALKREAGESGLTGRPFHPPSDLIGENMVDPAGRLLRGIVARLGPDALAALGPDGLRTFANRPNAVESPLPDCADLVAAYVRLRDRLASADAGSDAASAGTTTPDMTAAGAPDKLILTVAAQGVDLAIFDARGKRVDVGWIDYDMAVFGPNVPTPDLRDAPGTRWAALSPASRRMAEVLAAGRTLTPKELPEAFLHPERFDPLEFAAREGFLGLERPKGAKGFVAVLSDGLVGLANACVVDGRLNLSAFERSAFGPDGLERLDRGGTAVVRPADEAAAEAAATDRAALGAGIRRVLADGRFTVANWSALQFATYSSRFGPVKGAYEQRLLSLGLPRFSNGNGPSSDQYALLGAALAAGRPVVDGTEPPFARMLADGITGGGLAFSGGAGTSDLDRMPTSLLGSGALRRATVALSVADATVVGYVAGPPDEPFRAEEFSGFDVEHFATVPLFNDPLFRRNRRYLESHVKGAYLSPLYRTGTRTTTAVEVRLASGLASRFEIPVQVGDPKVLHAGELPPAFQEAIQRAIRRDLGDAPAPP